MTEDTNTKFINELYFDNSTKTHFFYDLFQAKQTHIIFLKDILKPKMLAARGYNYLTFDGIYISGEELFQTKHYTFFFPPILYKRTWKVCVNHFEFDIKLKYGVFLSLTKKNKKTLIFNHYKIIQTNDYNYEMEKALFLDKIIK